jgi:hypothetical protein
MSAITKMPFLSMFSICVSAVGVVAVALLILYRYFSLPSLRRRWEANPVSPQLSSADHERLRRWQARDMALFVTIMVSVIAFWPALGIGLLPAGALVPGYVFLMGLATVGLAHHFAPSCPVCGRNIGLQSGLALPRHCEVCRTALR